VDCEDEDKANESSVTKVTEGGEGRCCTWIEGKMIYAGVDSEHESRAHKNANAKGTRRAGAASELKQRLYLLTKVPPPIGAYSTPNQCTTCIRVMSRRHLPNDDHGWQRAGVNDKSEDFNRGRGA